MLQELLLVGPSDVRLSAYEEAPLQANEVRAQAVLSGISHGTELNIYRGTSPFHSKRFDKELRMFVEDADGQAYPRNLGYEWVGRVTEIGSQVTGFKAGDLVHLPSPHRQTQTFVAGKQTLLGEVWPLPAGFDPDRAVMLALAGVALQTVHDAHVKIGDRIAIFGLGTIGLLAVQLARLNGAGWIEAIDPIPTRRKLAEAFGADRTLDPNSCNVAYEIKTTSPQRGVDTAIELSGNYGALNDAIRSVCVGGTVVAAGFYPGGGTALHLGEEWHHNRVTMVSSMGVWGCPHRDHPAWNRARIHETAAGLLERGLLRTDGLITHRFPFECAADAYRLIDQRPEDVVKVVLTY
jgi:2-desacetyl-2-hydroxyethyl bacteriochlorophyllide A dehydrogenase